MTTEEHALDTFISDWTLATRTRPHQREVIQAPGAPETHRPPAQETTRESLAPDGRRREQ